jgi:hypothetical protein
MSESDTVKGKSTSWFGPVYPLFFSDCFVLSSSISSSFNVGRSFVKCLSHLATCLVYLAVMDSPDHSLEFGSLRSLP